MALKILGGEFRGRSIKVPEGSSTRPTKSLVRKAVFDILQSIIQDSIFLDLFAGSGVMGIEALSRGAKQAILVDSHRAAIRCIKANLNLLHLTQNATMMPCDVMEALKELERKSSLCDIIYVDPPYKEERLYVDLLHWVDRHRLLKPGGVLFMESARFFLPQESLGSLKPLLPRRYGSSMLYQFKKL